MQLSGFAGPAVKLRPLVIASRDGGPVSATIFKNSRGVAEAWRCAKASAWVQIPAGIPFSNFSGPEEEQQTRRIVSAKTAGAAPVWTAISP